MCLGLHSSTLSLTVYIIVLRILGAHVGIFFSVHRSSDDGFVHNLYSGSEISALIWFGLEGIPGFEQQQQL